MRLFICEKPKAARKLAAVLGPHKHIKATPNSTFAGHREGDGWRVAHLLGHVYRMKEPEDYDPSLVQWSLASLPIILREVQWKPLETSDTVPIEEIHAQIEHIKELYKTTSDVVIATDPEQEGQVIGQVFVQETGWTGKVYRLWSTVWEYESLGRKVRDLRPNSEFQGYYEAGVARTLADLLIGINFTRL